MVDDLKTTAERLREVHGGGDCNICHRPKAEAHGVASSFCSYPHGMLPVKSGPVDGFASWEVPADVT